MPQPIPVARKPLKRTDRLKRFAIPTKRLPLFSQFNGHHSVPVDFWHGSKPWPMVISIRMHGHKKPVISKGWIPFVRKNQLEVGDVVAIFRDEGEAGIRYRIEIERRSKPPRPTPVAVPTTYNSNFNVEVVANIPAIKQETQQAPEFRLNLDLTLALPVVAPEGNQAPSMGLFGTEAENFNRGIV